MQNFLKTFFNNLKTTINFKKTFNLKQRNFDLELFIYKILEEKNIRLRNTNKDNIEEVVHKLIEKYDKYKNTSIKLKKQNINLKNRKDALIKKLKMKNTNQK